MSSMRAIGVRFDRAIHHPSSRFSSSSSRKVENAAKRRALRKSGSSDDSSRSTKVDYRFRRGSANRNTAALWGQTTMDGEDVPSNERPLAASSELIDKTNSNVASDSDGFNNAVNKPFVSFFDEVDAKMNTTHNRYSISSSIVNADAPQQFSKRKDITTLAAFFGALDDEMKEVPKKTGQHTASFLDSLDTLPMKSIFDVFSVPEPLQPPNPNAYDPKMFLEYKTAMLNFVNDDEFRVQKFKRKLRVSESEQQAVVDWLLNEERVVKYDLTVLKDAIEHGFSVAYQNFSFTTDSKEHLSIASSNVDYEGEAKAMYCTLRRTFRSDVQIPGTQAHTFCKQLSLQKYKFQSHINMTSKQYQLAMRGLTRLGDLCAKHAKPLPLVIAWEKIKEAGMILSSNDMNTYLYTAGKTTCGFGSLGNDPFFGSKHFGGSGSSIFGNDSMKGSELLDEILGKTPLLHDKSSTTNNHMEQKTESEEDGVELPIEVAVFHDLLFKPTETSINLRVKALVTNGDARGAEKLLDTRSSQDDARLRTYLPILRLYIENGDIPSALSLFKRMRNVPTVVLEPENYVFLIATIAEKGFFRAEAASIEGALELGYPVASGPLLLDSLMEEMAEDVLEITSASAQRLYNALAIGFSEERMAKKLKPMHSLAGMKTTTIRAEEDELVACRVTLNEKTAVCPRTGAKLKLIMLEKDQRKQLHDDLLSLAASQYEKFGWKKSELDYASKELARFANWLDTRKGKPFTAIIDGPNVAYYMQNFVQGKFNYHQIQFMVDALVKMNENPLVIIPHKYASSTFHVTMGSSAERQTLSVKEREILENLTKTGRLYKVSAGCLDDYYWMLASVSDQTVSRNGANMDVDVDNAQGRWPGTRPMLVTNDQMRDHKLQLMEPRMFRRWTSCHIVNYNFTAFVHSECIDNEIGFSTADFFSREIQGNPTPGRHGTQGGGGGGGTAWHLPVSDWDLDDRFCIRIPYTKSQSEFNMNGLTSR